LSQRQTYHGSGALAFSTKGEYGVRLMVQLGRRYGTGPASLAEIAGDEELPRPYLEQLAIALRDAGLVVSTRGARGGYELSRPPGEIAMADVLRALEGPIAPMVCASEEPDHLPGCDRTSRCTVNLLWVRIRDAIAESLDSITLADLVPSRTIALEGLVGRASGEDTSTNLPREAVTA
jgi:Rrf2 family cysteine metabolism transcriptional repressor